MSGGDACPGQDNQSVSATDRNRHERRRERRSLSRAPADSREFAGALSKMGAYEPFGTTIRTGFADPSVA